MTVISAQSNVIYTGDGSSKQFTIPFYFLESSHIRVIATDLAGNVTEPVQNVAYTVSGAGVQSGGSALFVTAPVNGVRLLIQRVVPATQMTDYQPNDDFPAESHERALDKLTMLAQQSSEVNERALQRPVGRYYFDAQLAQIKSVASPTQPNDAANMAYVESYVASILATGQGPVNQASNVFYSAPDGQVHTLQELSSLTDRTKGAALIGFNPTGIGATATTVQAALDKLNQKSTGQFYSAFGAKVNRLADRVFIGDAINHDGGITQAQPDWFTVYMRNKGRDYAFVGSSTLAVTNSLNTDASNTALIASHTGDLYPGWNAIGLIAIGVGNNPNTNPLNGVAGHAYAIYGEAYRDAGVPGGAYGAELDVMNYADLVSVDPYVQRTGQTIGLQLAGGGEFPGNNQSDISAAINVRNNGSAFYRGIVFGADSLTGSDGVNGVAIAIAMAKGHKIQWFAGTDAGTASIYCTNTLAASSISQEFGDNYVRFQANSGYVLQIESTAMSTNYLIVRGQVSGLPVQLLARGAEANVDLQLNPKGTGSIWTGPYTAGAITATGYVTMKDSAGLVRRFLVG